jgi:hypothetical protein
MLDAGILAGGVQGLKQEASELITKHKLDDTFYIIDLANVVRLYKVRCPGSKAAEQDDSNWLLWEQQLC